VALQEMEDGPVIRARKARQDRIGGGSCEDVGGAASERLVDTSGATCGYDGRDQDGCCDDTPPKSPGRAHDLWRKVKKQYELVEYHVLPEYLRDNEFILRHYRSDWPMKETLLSIFTIHNETLNIWT
jgi:adiponectin receptor